MGVSWGSSGDILVAFDIVDQKIEQAVNTIQEISNDLLENAAQTGKDIIGSTPSSIVPGKTNRVHSGEMQDSVDFKAMRSSGRKSWSGEAGWVFSVEEYFKTQEHGGTTPSSWGRFGGRTISPMHMLTGMRTELEQDLHERLVAEFGS